MARVDRLVILLTIGLVAGGALSSANAQIVLEDQYFDSNGVRIRYVETGSGEPIVLGHGGGGRIESSWIQTGVLENLAKDYRIIAFDHRGHGKSDKPHDVSAYGAEMGQDIVRLLDHLGINRAHIIGYSMGSRIVGHLVTTNPERFLTATLGASPPFRNWDDDDERTAQQRAEELQSRQSLIDEGQDFVALAASMRSQSDRAVTDEDLSKVRVPTMAIIGSEDPRLPQITNLRTVMTELQIVVIDGATHAGEKNARARPEFVEAIRSFVALHSAEH